MKETIDQFKNDLEAAVHLVRIDKPGKSNWLYQTPDEATGMGLHIPTQFHRLAQPRINIPCFLHKLKYYRSRAAERRKCLPKKNSSLV